MSFTPAREQEHGVVLALFPAGSGWRIRLERAPALPAAQGGGPDASATQDLGLAPPDASYWIDRLPPDAGTFWYRIRHTRDGYLDSPPTGWRAGKPALLPEAIYPPQPVAPEFAETLAETNARGTLQLGVVDPQSRVVEVAATRRIHGSPDEPVPPVTDPGPVTEFWVPLDEKHFNSIEYRVRYYDAQAQLRDRIRTVSFDVGAIPNVVSIDAEVGADGLPLVRLRGDTDTFSWRVFGVVGATFPTDAQVQAVPARAGRDLDVTLTGVTVAPGQQVRIAALPYPAADGSGEPGPRGEAMATMMAVPSASVELIVEADGDARIQAAGVANVGSFAYTWSTAGYDNTGARTVVNLAPGQSLAVPLVRLEAGERIYLNVWLHPGTGGQGPATGPFKHEQSYVRADYPRIEQVSWLPSLLGLRYKLLSFRVRDPRNLGGVLKVWLNASGPETPDPALAPDATLTLASTPFTAGYNTVFNLAGGGTATLLRAIMQNARESKRVYVEFINTNDLSSGQVALGVPSRIPILRDDGDIEDGTIRGGHVQPRALNATHLDVTHLADISPSVGTLSSGRLEHTTSSFLDLDASGSAAFLQHPSLQLKADGTAVFSGSLGTSNFTGPVSFPSTLTVRGPVYVETTGTISAEIQLHTGSTGSIIRQIGGAGPLEITTPGIDLLIGTSTVSYLNSSGWHAHAFIVYSPAPDKADEQMSAADWIAWGAEDARKPRKPYEGIPRPGHPEVQARAEREGKSVEQVLDEEAGRYAKDVSKIAIGTARWADAVHRALAGAKDFADFKRRLEAHRG